MPLKNAASEAKVASQACGSRIEPLTLQQREPLLHATCTHGHG